MAFDPFSAVVGFADTLINGAQARQSQSIANDFSAQQFASRYQTTVADMKAAGLNPMLAYQQGGGNAPSGASQPGIHSNIASAYTAGRTAPAQASRDYASAGEATSKIPLNEENAKLAAATVSKVEQDISYSKSDQERVKAVILNLGQEYQNLMKQNWNLTEIGNQLRASIDLMKAQAGNQNMQAALAGAQDALQKQLKLSEEHRTELLRIDKDAASSFGELGKTVGALEPFLKLVWAAFRR